MLDPGYKVSRDYYEMDYMYSIAECSFYLKWFCDLCWYLYCQRNLLSSWIIPQREKNLLILVRLTTIAIVNTADTKDNSTGIELNKVYKFTTVAIGCCCKAKDKNSS